MIYFTGGGCYHPDMLTIGAMKLLQKADCVLYDHLINKEFERKREELNREFFMPTTYSW